MRRLAFSIGALFLAASGLVACGNSSSSSGTGGSGAGGAGGSGGSGGATTTSLKEPKVHRAAATTCPMDRPPGQAADPQMGDACEKDADCTKGKNGRCVGSIVVKNHCSYDECFADADCGSAEACECRNPAAASANTCIHGNCRLDSDCGPGGWCSPSAVTLDPSCAFQVSPASIGYFCHTAADTCTDDADCGSNADKSCIFSVDAMRWQCQGTPCAG
jgi:hypothetical protein